MFRYGCFAAIREGKMSYDICLRDKEGKAIELEELHSVRGGTYACGGTTEAWLNVTYNYSKFFYAVMGDKGIRRIYGMTGRDSIPVLDAAIAAMAPDLPTPNYWAATEGNARQALKDLKTLAEAAPDGIWEGD